MQIFYSKVRKSQHKHSETKNIKIKKGNLTLGTIIQGIFTLSMFILCKGYRNFHLYSVLLGVASKTGYH